MARSLKKGPYVDEKLLKRVLDLNRTNAKRVIGDTRNEQRKRNV